MRLRRETAGEWVSSLLNIAAEWSAGIRKPTVVSRKDALPETPLRPSPYFHGPFRYSLSWIRPATLSSSFTARHGSSS